MNAHAQNKRLSTAAFGSGGYILVEAVVALVVLSIGAYAIHGSIRQAVLTRGQAHDYTHARFLMQELIAKAELQPQLMEEVSSGTFEPPYERFSYELEIARVALPMPSEVEGDQGETNFKFPSGFDYLARLRVNVYWARSDQSFSETMETLLAPSKLYQAPEAL